MKVRQQSVTDRHRHANKICSKIHGKHYTVKIVYALILYQRLLTETITVSDCRPRFK